MLLERERQEGMPRVDEGHSRDGEHRRGAIVIGVAEVNHQYVFAGLQTEQADTWETTRLNNFVNGYADPPVNCTLSRSSARGDSS